MKQSNLYKNEFQNIEIKYLLNDESKAMKFTFLKRLISEYTLNYNLIGKYNLVEKFFKE